MHVLGPSLPFPRPLTHLGPSLPLHEVLGPSLPPLGYVYSMWTQFWSWVRSKFERKRMSSPEAQAHWRLMRSRLPPPPPRPGPTVELLPESERPQSLPSRPPEG